MSLDMATDHSLSMRALCHSTRRNSCGALIARHISQTKRERGDRSRAPSARVGSVAAVRCAHNRQIILANFEHLSIDIAGAVGMAPFFRRCCRSPALSTRHPSRYHIHRTHSVCCISCKRHVAVFRCACACGVC